MLRSLKEENTRLMSRINNPIQNSDSNAKDNAESKSATDAETCDKTIDTNGSDSLSGKIPNIEDKNIDEYGTETTQVEDSHTVEIKPPVLYVPAPKISPSKELNNNLAEYVIVTDNLSKPELVVLDSEDNDEGDEEDNNIHNLTLPTSTAAKYLLFLSDVLQYNCRKVKS